MRTLLLSVGYDENLAVVKSELKHTWLLQGPGLSSQHMVT